MSSRRFISPSRITYDELPKFLQLRSHAASLQDCKIECDCSKLVFVDPLGLCLLKHWFVELQERAVEVHLRGLRREIESFLRRMDLFEGLALVSFEDRSSMNTRRDMTGRMIELRSLHETKDIGQAASQIAKTIVHGIPGIEMEPDPDQMHPSLGERIEDTLEYVFSEILLNSLEHGRRRNYVHSHANIAALYYPVINKLEIAIVDNGCGLLETLQGHQLMAGELTDSKAISIARQPRVSCNRDAELGLDVRNQGIGLTVSTEIALAARGRCGIFSGLSRHSILTDSTADVSEIPYWRGTGVYFQFDKTALASVNKGSIIKALPGYRIVNKIKFD